MDLPDELWIKIIDLVSCENNMCIRLISRRFRDIIDKHYTLVGLHTWLVCRHNNDMKYRDMISYGYVRLQTKDLQFDINFPSIKMVDVIQMCVRIYKYKPKKLIYWCGTGINNNISSFITGNESFVFDINGTECLHIKIHRKN